MKNEKFIKLNFDRLNSGIVEKQITAIETEDVDVLSEAIKIVPDFDVEVFSTLLNLLPKELFDEAIEHYSAQKNCKSFGILHILSKNSITEEQFTKVCSLITLDSLSQYTSYFTYIPMFNKKYTKIFVARLIEINYTEWKWDNSVDLDLAIPLILEQLDADSVEDYGVMLLILSKYLNRFSLDSEGAAKLDNFILYTKIFGAAKKFEKFSLGFIVRLENCQKSLYEIK